MNLNNCYACNGPLVPGNRKRKELRPRKCPACIAARVAEKRATDPVLLLKHRLYNSLVNKWPDIDANMYSAETVKYVMQRWGGKSVLSGESSAQLLCITAFRRDRVPRLQDLVLVTSREAQRMARLSPEKLSKTFSAAIWEELTMEK